MTVSIAMCTRNGVPFVEQQLASIARQSQLPDELIVCDDASTDATAAIVQRFAAAAPFTVRLHVNSSPLGIAKNFEQAMARCSGELTFLCDQDDIWHPAKIATMAERFRRDGSLAALFSDARRVDAEGNPLPRSLWQQIAFTRRDRRETNAGRLFRLLLDRNVVTGATVAFRTSLRAALLPVPDDPGMLHDRWIALVLAAISRVDCVDEALIDYREHSGQHSGAGDPAGGVERWIEAARNTTAADYAKRAAELRLAFDRLRTIDAAPPAILRELAAHIAHLEFRASLPPQRLRRILPVMRELVALRYHKHSNHLWSVAKDLFG